MDNLIKIDLSVVSFILTTLKLYILKQQLISDIHQDSSRSLIG